MRERRLRRKRLLKRAKRRSDISSDKLREGAPARVGLEDDFGQDLIGREDVYRRISTLIQEVAAGINSCGCGHIVPGYLPASFRVRSSSRWIVSLPATTLSV